MSMKRVLDNRVRRRCEMTGRLIGLLMVSALAGSLAAQAPARRLPTFEVDRNWPKVPAKWKLGDPSSFAIDAQDHVWLLHRPRTLVKPEDAKMAAPPVMVFDTAGNFIKAWGGNPSTAAG